MFEGEYCSILKSGFLRPPALGTEMDGIEDISVSETLEVSFSPLVLTVEAMTLPLLFT